MREIWLHSARPGQGSGPVGVWWGVWLISNWVDNIVVRVPGVASDAADLVSNLIDIGAGVLAVLVARRITAWQSASQVLVDRRTV